MQRLLRRERSLGYFEAIQKTVLRIPRGKVATYGEVARAAGYPGTARQVAWALRDSDVRGIPWQRVLGQGGRILLPGAAGLHQRTLLELEGVNFRGGRADMRSCGYHFRSGRSKAALTAMIRDEAARLGFFRMGVAPAGPLPGGEILDRWLQAGMHGEMRYLARQAPRRKHPDLVLPGVRSIVTLAASYHAGVGPDEAPDRARVSCYAAGTDYHHVLAERLRLIEELIVNLAPVAKVLTYVDTGPVMEKAWGALGGLGWIGKHSNLITRQQGSWFFLGTILLNIELEYGRREPDRCGTCERCISACPTGAIVRPHVVDARRCISYLTIELRGMIPRSLRPLIGNRIFGCDDCQEACPWNRFAVRTPFEEFLPRAGGSAQQLTSLAHLTAEQFRLKYAGTAVLRPGRDGFVRNVVVALGNSGLPDAVDVLRKSVRDEGPIVRAHAAWALGRIGGRDAMRILADAHMREQSPEVSEEIELALEETRDRV